MMESDQKEKEVLRQLESGEIDVDEAVRRLEDDDSPQAAVEQDPSDRSGFEPPSRWQLWWMIPLMAGLVMLVGGYWLGTLGGAWWICAAPTLLLGLIVVTLAAISTSAPWVHVRVRGHEEGTGSNVRVSLPLPLGLTGFVLRRFGHLASDKLDETMVDEILVALEGNLKGGDPIFIEVDDDESGERVEVYLG